MFAIFGPAILVALLLAVPLWVFLIPILVLAGVCVRFRRRTGVRNICVAIGLLIAVFSIPFVAVQTVYRIGADDRLSSEFSVPACPGIVVRYRFQPGLLDGVEYWRLWHADPNACARIIADNNMTQIWRDRWHPPGSVNGSPGWWPKSPSGYSVFEGEDGRGGTREIWISQVGTTTYFYRFIE